METKSLSDRVKLGVVNKWGLVLSELAPDLRPALVVPGKHVGCPNPEGRHRTKSRDGFRVYKEVHERGAGVCNTCGKFSDGFALLMWINGWSFMDTVKAIASVLGIEEYDRPPIDPKKIQQAELEAAEQQRSAARREAWRAKQFAELTKEGLPVSRGTPASLYLKNRSLINLIGSRLRFHPSLPCYEGKKLVGHFPAMLAPFTVKGEVVAYQRYFLTQDGFKADVVEPKMFIQKSKFISLEGGAVVMPSNGIVHGVAEGLETAWSCTLASCIPTDAALNAWQMEVWEPPAGVSNVLIWVDKDLSQRGEEAANALEARLKPRGIQCYKLIPKRPIPDGMKSWDWADEWVSKNSEFPNLTHLRDLLRPSA